MSSSPSAGSRQGLAALLVILLAACGDDGVKPPAPLEIPEGCNPLTVDGTECLLPFPTDAFRAPAEGASGASTVRIPARAQLEFAGEPLDLVAAYPTNGFSPATPILALFGGEIDPSALPSFTAPGTSLEPSSPTSIVDAETGERIPHFAELDPRAESDDRRALLLRPLVRLDDDRRYVVGIRRLRRPNGDEVPTPRGFASLRDDGGAAHPTLDAMASRYDAEIFPVLQGAGVPRAELSLAWDFTTRSEADAIGDMLTIREASLSRLADAPPVAKIVEVLDDVDAYVARRIEATVEVPLFVDSAEPNAALVRGPDGAVVAKGIAEVPFSIFVPRSVADRAPGAPPARVVQYGHGFFGTREEAAGYPCQLADELGVVLVAADWWGMSKPDRARIADALTSDPAELGRFTDRVHQAMANFLFVAAAAQGSVATWPELEIHGAPAYDASTLYFYGISLGQILGSIYATLTPSIERIALSVGGANYGLMMFRSKSFSIFLLVLGQTQPDLLDQQKFVALAQTTFDRIDPAVYAPRLLERPLPQSPASRKVLMQVGMGDLNVPNVASYVQARAIGLPILSPSPVTPFGLDAVTSPHDGSAAVIFDFGIDPLPDIIAIPPAGDNGVHEGVRREPAGKAQLDKFLRPGGLIEHTCDGPCDPG